MLEKLPCFEDLTYEKDEKATSQDFAKLTTKA
jgi:hypothetical protein